MALTIEQQVQQLYIGVLGRAADKAGFDYWVAEVTSGNLTIDQVAASFFDQPETQALYPAGTTNDSFVIAAYDNVFNRAPDVAGGQYWVGQLNAGLGRDVFIEALMNGAVDSASAVPPTFDLSLLTNQTIAAQYYTDSAAASAALYTAADAASILVPVTANASSIATSEALTDVIASGNVPGEVFTLTTAINNFTGTAYDDTFNASLDAGFNTLNAQDQLNGNGGIDTLNAIISSSVTPLSLQNIEVINLTNAGTAARSVGLVNAGQALEVTNSGSDNDLTVTGLAATATTLNVYDTDSASTFQYISSAGTQTVDLTVDNVGVSTAATVTLAGIETINLQSGDGTTQANAVNLSATSATTVTISGESDLTLTGASAATLIDASDFNGDLTANINVQVSNTSATTVTGGSGDDIFIVDSEQVGTGTVASSLDGGDGSNILSVTWATDQANVVDAGSITITNIQGMALTAENIAGVGAVDLGLNAALVGGLEILSLEAQDTATTNVFTISGLTAAQTVSVGEAVTGAQLELSGGTGVTAVNVGLNIGADSTALFDINQTGTALTTLNLTTDGNSYSNVDAEAGPGTFTTINVSGGASGEALTIGGSNAIIATTFNAATFESDITATFGTANQSIVGGTGDDTFIFTTNLSTADTINGGAGDNTVNFTLGAGLIGPTLSNIQNLDVALIGASNTMSLQNASGVEAITIVSSAAVTNDATFSNLDASLANVTVEDDVDVLSVTTTVGQLANATLTIGGDGTGALTADEVTMNTRGSLSVESGLDTAARTQTIGTTLATNATSLTFASQETATLDVAGVVTANSATAVTVNAVSADTNVDGANSFDVLDSLSVNATLGAIATFIGTSNTAEASLTIDSITLTTDDEASEVSNTVSLTASTAAGANLSATLGSLVITNGLDSDVNSTLNLTATNTGAASITSATITNSGDTGDLVDVNLNFTAAATGTASIGTLNVAATAATSEVNVDLDVNGAETVVTIGAGALTGAGQIDVTTTDLTQLDLSALTVSSFTGTLSVVGDADLDVLTGTSYGETLDVELNTTGADVTGGEGSDTILLDGTFTAIDTVIYLSQSDSTGTVYDYVSEFEAGAGGDEIDLSALLLGGAAYNSTVAAATVTFTDATDVTFTITAGDAVGFFANGVAVSQDDTGANATVVFVDANLSGSWEEGSDMAIVLNGVVQTVLTDAANFAWV